MKNQSKSTISRCLMRPGELFGFHLAACSQTDVLGFQNRHPWKWMGRQGDPRWSCTRTRYINKYWNICKNIAPRLQNDHLKLQNYTRSSKMNPRGSEMDPRGSKIRGPCSKRSPQGSKMDPRGSKMAPPYFQMSPRGSNWPLQDSKMILEIPK